MIKIDIYLIGDEDFFQFFITRNALCKKEYAGKRVHIKFLEDAKKELKGKSPEKGDAVVLILGRNWSKTKKAEKEGNKIVEFFNEKGFVVL